MACDCPSGRAIARGEPEMRWYTAAHSFALPDMSLNPQMHGERDAVLAEWEAAEARRAASEARMADIRRRAVADLTRLRVGERSARVLELAVALLAMFGLGYAAGAGW